MSNIGHSMQPGESPKDYMQREHSEIRAYLSLAIKQMKAGRRQAARVTLRRAARDITEHFASEEDDVFPMWSALHPNVASQLRERLAEHPRLLRMLTTLDNRPFTTRELQYFTQEIEDHAAREERLFGIIAGR